MDRAILSLTRKDLNRNPIGLLILDIQFIKAVTAATSLYSFSFDPQSDPKLEFMLVGDDCITFFSLLDDILSPNTTIPNPPTTIVTTADPNGNPKGKLQLTVAKVTTFIDKISLFSYKFELDDNRVLEFNLTSTDAAGFFSDFDAILWSNPPNPPH